MRKFDYTFLKNQRSRRHNELRDLDLRDESKGGASPNRLRGRILGDGIRREDTVGEKFQCHRGDNHDGQAYPRHREQIHRAAGT